MGIIKLLKFLIIFIYQNKKIYFFMIPGLVFWVGVYPLLCLILLRKNKLNIDKPIFIAKYGFFLNGFKKSLYFW